jgi:hypothetical protein
MLSYSLREKTFILETYFSTKSYAETRKRFHIRFPASNVPCDSTITRLTQKFRSEGTVSSNVLEHRNPSVLTAETLMNIQAAVYESPHISVRKISRQVNASKTTVHVALRQHLGMYPFRASVTHQLLPHDFPARVFFCEWISEVLEYEPAFLERCFFSDEAWFHLDGFVNSQNFRQWSTDNPRLIIERPLHPQKIGVWSAMSSRRIFFLFFEQTVNSSLHSLRKKCSLHGFNRTMLLLTQLMLR